jgi:4-diphosphocytidyl-2-C-methyl-D-erythritol kinase
MTVEVFAPAKINLTLHVTGQRPDGYHELDSLVAFAEVGDTITARPAERPSLALDGPFAAGLEPGGDNLVLRAARLLPGPPGAALTLTKRLPIASGIGGGSSDAAAALLALSRLHGLPLPGAEALAGLGADLPVCLHRRACRMRGVGEVLEEVPPLPACDLLLVNPGVAVPTPQMFRALARKDNPGMGALPAWRSLEDFASWLAGQRNDLLAPASAAHPVLRDVLARLRGTGALHAGMSGSGATCFGLYPTGGAAEAARRAVAADRPGWWCAAGAMKSFSG